MGIMQFLVVVCCLAMAVIAAQEVNKTETVELTISLGQVRGSFMKSRLGKKIYTFRGMRYGEPPVGPLRFKQAVPTLPWNDVYDATQEGPACSQPNGENKGEDCLRLNVYSTKLPSKNRREAKRSKRPVIIYFHSGGWYGMSGQSFIHGPQYLMDQDIVLVVPNFRLAAMGFLSTGDAVAPGNLGLKDQVEAMRWVQKNIAAFGGDPNCVTISGYSAGGWSVSVHMVSPMTKGLFHRAITMSGASTFQEPLPHHQRELTDRVAKLLDCPTNTSQAIFDCLYTKSATDIGNTISDSFDWNGDPIALWLPVVEPEVPGVERFLTAQPVDLIRQGKFYDVPLIAGLTRDEFGGAMVSPIEEARKGNTSAFDFLNENWERLAPIIFLYERNTPRSRQISEALRQFYLKGKPISLDNVEGVSQLYADGVIGFPTHRFVNLVAKVARSPVYYYKFAYQGRYSWVTWSDTGKPFGVTHHDDLLYLFYITWYPYFEENAPEIPTVERMTSMWANFAKTGNPIPCHNEKFANVTWTPFTVQNQKFLEIGNELTMQRNLYIDRMNEWERLFPLQPLPKVKHH